MHTVRSRAVVALVAVVVVLATLPGVAAAESRTGGVVTVEAGETVAGDLEAFGGTVVVEGTVEGDLEAVGGTVVIDGTVEGDVDASGGSVEIGGTVGGSVRAAAGTVRLTENARVGDDLEAAGGSVVVDGEVGDDARLSADEISLGPNAAVGGDLTYEGDLSGDTDAVVAGSVDRSENVQVRPVGPSIGPQFGEGSGLLWGYGVLVNLLAGAVLLAALPGFSRRVADTAATEPIRSGGVGALVLVAIPLVLLLVAATIVGIPLSLAGAFLALLVGWAGALLGRYAVGAWLLSLADAENRWVALLVGVLLVAAVRALPVPVVGDLVRAAVFLLGFGALALVVYRRQSSPDESGPETSGTDADVDGPPEPT